MKSSQKPEIPSSSKYDSLSEECKTLISSLPSDKDFEGKNLCNYHGFWYYYTTLQSILHVQKQFHPYDTDVILSSFPKSGTTWLKALVFALFERNKPYFDRGKHPLFAQNPHNLIPFLELELYASNQVPDLTEYSSPRLFATHMPMHTLSETLKGSPCKVVYLCRELKDILVSDWHFKPVLLNSEIQLEDIYNSYCKGVHFYGPFWDLALSYWKYSLEYPKQVFFMRFEEIKENPQMQLKKLAEFLDCPITEEEEHNGLVDEILELCSLSNLSNFKVNKFGKTIFGVDSKFFFRKGEVGDWKNHLTHDMVKGINEIIEKKLRGSGLRFE